MSWEVVMKPEGKNPHVRQDDDPGSGKNHGGLVIGVTDAAHNCPHCGKEIDRTQEVERVAFQRRHSKNPGTTFKSQVQRSVHKASELCDILNNGPESLS